MNWPDWLEPLLDAEQMRATDRWAVEEAGALEEALMERAGSGLAAVAAEMAPKGAIAVVCGRGNNGGDGLVAARILHQRGRRVEVLIPEDGGRLSEGTRTMLERLHGARPHSISDGIPPGASLVIDALLGTGAVGAPRDDMRAAIEAICNYDAPVLAADMPSGVDASTGETAGLAVTAQQTATFHAAKPGLWIAPGCWHAGKVSVVDIGIPDDAPLHATTGLIAPEVLASIPPRARGSNKYTSGHVLVAGGSEGLTGAACLAALAAMRAGAGYVTAFVPASLSVIFETRLLEVITRALPDSGGAHTREGVAAVLAASERAGALVLGPGLGRSHGAGEFARELAARAQVPLVLDADGLNVHATAGIRERAAATVMTPHEGELGRMLDVPTQEISAARLRTVRAAAERFNSIVVLKGDDTLVASPDGLIAVSGGATPALATAGTGDVLAGVIGALLARGLEAFTAACAGVRLHAFAGIRAAEGHGSEGVIASDVVDALPGARLL